MLPSPAMPTTSTSMTSRTRTVARCASLGHSPSRASRHTVSLEWTRTVDMIAESSNGYGSEYDFAQIMLDNLEHLWSATGPQGGQNWS